MNPCKQIMPASMTNFAVFLAVLLSVSFDSIAAQQSGPRQDDANRGQDNRALTQDCEPSHADSPYIPVDSSIYPAMLQLYSMGYVDNVYLGMRPWTHASVSRMLEGASAQIEDADNYGDPTAVEARDIVKALARELNLKNSRYCVAPEGTWHFESAYTVARAIGGTPLRDSYHLGSSIINDYGRPYARGLNSYSGASGYASTGRFLLYARGEFQGAPSEVGYSSLLATQLASLDVGYYPVTINPTTGLPYTQATIPAGPIHATAIGRFVEAYVSTHLLDHEISFGKQDDWLGPGLGGGMAYSNNAENIYSFRINRTEPLCIPGLSRFTGPFRYDFLVGPLRGHIYPDNPWVHVEQISFRPTINLEFGFERTVIWGGKGHVPITVATFLRSFFSLTAPTPAVKASRQDPGARFGAFNFSYRLPLLRNWFTLYSDSEVHDDLSPIAAPRRSSWRPGLYLSHLPLVPKLDIRAEAASTDPPVLASVGGQFMYYEYIQQQGYTNKGQIFGDWIGREGKGGQGWITYHMSGNEWFQLGIRAQKVAKDFIPGGTTLNEINFQAVKRIDRDFEIEGDFAYERYKAPVYMNGTQAETSTTIQFTWFPRRAMGFGNHSTIINK